MFILINEAFLFQDYMYLVKIHGIWYLIITFHGNFGNQ